MSKPFGILLASALFASAAASVFGGSPRLRMIPQLQPGQALIYLVSYQSNRNVKTQSHFALPDQPGATKLGVEGMLRVEVLARDAQGLHIRTKFEIQQPSASSSGKPVAKGLETQPDAPNAKWVEFTLKADGSVTNLTGLDSLPPEQQAAWREWLSRFAASMAFPQNGIQRGEKWQTQEVETAPSPIAGLVWRRKSQYVRDEPCPVATRTAQGDVTEGLSKDETCAVIVITSELTQKSSRKDSTPEDYKLHHLQTKGIANGTNQTVLYISHRTGLLMRSTESDTQAMDVAVSLADGSNQVRYTITATGRAHLLILQDASSPSSR
jgi:hypothetical protein